MTRTLSKSKLMAFRQCPKRLWLQVHAPYRARVDAGREARFASGNKVGEIARQLRPGGELIEDVTDFATAKRVTRELLATEGDVLLFEPAFAAGGALARVDVLQRGHGLTRLVEVKSATSFKETYYEDVAVQAWVGNMRHRHAADLPVIRRDQDARKAQRLLAACTSKPERMPH